jgi:hypothetical protein
MLVRRQALFPVVLPHSEMLPTNSCVPGQLRLLISRWRVKLMLLLPGSRLTGTSRAEDTGLAPNESAIEPLCS